MREMKSMNSWLHNAARLMPESRSHFAVVHPADAEAYQIRDGEMIAITSAAGSIETRAKISDEIKVGHIAVPHGWGHRGGWSRANAKAGVNTNLVANVALSEIEPLSATSVVNGIPVSIRPVPASAN